MLTTSERSYLLNSMEDLLNEYDYEYSSHALERIIDEWVRQKAGLIEAFKKHPNYIEEKFMIAFDADYERVVDSKQSTTFGRWVINQAIHQVFNQLPADALVESWFGGMELKSDINRFFYYLGGYAERCVSEENANIINTIFPSVKAHAGQKTSRIVNKICAYLGIDKADDYNREFAKYADSLSPMVIKRHTVLSINPLDYLTMSFGNSWASCHTIDKSNKRGMPNSYSGCYSSGTISYMLDKTSMVFYTVDASYKGDEYWNQPKINRQMFHYGEEKLVQARLYPQDNDGCSSVYEPYRGIVQKIMSEIFEFPNLWVLKKGTSEICNWVRSDGTHYRDYSHYGNCTISFVKGSSNSTRIMIGARPICIECGDRHYEEKSINHCACGYVCSDCGEHIDEDDVIWINGDPYCSDCVHYCENCDEYHRGRQTWIPSENRYVCECCLDNNYIFCECCDEYVHEDNAYYIESEGRYVCEDCYDRHYFCCDDCGEYFHRDELHDHEYMNLCSSCYKERTTDENDEAC